MAAQRSRAQRRTARTKAAHSRAARGRHSSETPWQRRARRRRWIVFGAVGVLVLALVGGVTAALLGAGGTGTGAGAGAGTAPGLTAQTLLNLPAASAVASGDGAGFVADDQRDVVERFDPADGKVEATTHLAGRPFAMVVDGADVWIAETVTNTVLEATASTLHIERGVVFPYSPTGLAVFGPDVWVSSVAGHDVTPINAETGQAGTPVSVLAGAVRVASGYGALWVTGTTDLVTHIVPSGDGTAPAQDVVTVGKGPIGVATGAGAVWVANAEGGTVSRIDPGTLAVTTLQETPADPESVTVAGRQVFVSSGTQQTVQVVAPSASHALAIGTEPRNLVAVGTGVWVAGSSPGKVVDVT